MLKKILILAVIVFMGASVSFASKTYLIDTPTVYMLSYGSYDTNFRFFSDGGITSKLEFGVLKILNLGISWELEQFIGCKQTQAAIPALQVKFKAYNGDMLLPAVAVGYDGQGYFFDPGNSKYLQKNRGIYLIISRELFMESLVFNVGINVNDFSKPKTYGFINVITPLYKEYMYFMAEYDNVYYSPAARFNFGFKVSLTEYMDVDLIMKDFKGKEDVGRTPNEKIFKISYSGKF
jgi:hypothetical protein